MITPEEVVAGVFGVSTEGISEVTSNRTLEQWDSLGHVTLIMEIEAVYGVSLSTEEALAVTDVAAIRRLLVERGVRW